MAHADAPRRARKRLTHSVQLRMVLVFLLLAAGMTFVFVASAQRAFAVGWRDAARPLLADYVDRLAAELTGADGLPSIERARALAGRLPVTVSIDGPVVRWTSRPAPAHPAPSLERRTADGHTLRFGLDTSVLERRPRVFALALGTMLLLTLLAWLAVRHMLRPLADIGAGAQRFGAGDFSLPIPVRHGHRPDELGQLAATVNAMGEDIHRMLEAKRALLLAISHELRSPLTRARLHAELLPEDGEAGTRRAALLRDLQEIASLITDLLESERLASRHAALQREPLDLPALARAVIGELAPRHARASQVVLQADAALPTPALDAARMRLLLRNLLDNALRHAADAPLPPELRLQAGSDGGVVIELRDHGPGVADEQLARLAQPFHRPDSARTRAAGGVGLGLYLARLVAQAHGGTLELQHARSGLRVRVVLPAAGPVGEPAA